MTNAVRPSTEKTSPGNGSFLLGCWLSVGSLVCWATTGDGHGQKQAMTRTRAAGKRCMGSTPCALRLLPSIGRGLIDLKAKVGDASNRD
jgi:hypothetical protein